MWTRSYFRPLIDVIEEEKTQDLRIDPFSGDEEVPGLILVRGLGVAEIIALDLWSFRRSFRHYASVGQGILR